MKLSTATELPAPQRLALRFLARDHGDWWLSSPCPNHPLRLEGIAAQGDVLVRFEKRAWILYQDGGCSPIATNQV